MRPTHVERESAPHDRRGLCATCRHAGQVVSAKGSVYTRCGLSSIDPRFAKYPVLPVLHCDGYERPDGVGR